MRACVCMRAFVCVCWYACVNAYVQACLHACTMYVKAFGKGIFRPIHKIWYLAHRHKIKKMASVSVSVVYWKVAQSLSRNYPGGCAQMI